MDPAEAAQETFESSSNAESVGRLLYNENKLDPDLKKGWSIPANRKLYYCNAQIQLPYFPACRTFKVKEVANK